jgi:hypothetical protein
MLLSFGDPGRLHSLLAPPQKGLCEIGALLRGDEVLYISNVVSLRLDDRGRNRETPQILLPLIIPCTTTLHKNTSVPDAEYSHQPSFALSKGLKYITSTELRPKDASAQSDMSPADTIAWSDQVADSNRLGSPRANEQKPDRHNKAWAL